jgi:hypothetical protein
LTSSVAVGHPLVGKYQWVNPFLVAASAGESGFLKFAVPHVLDLKENGVVLGRYVEIDEDNVLVGSVVLGKVAIIEFELIAYFYFRATSQNF